MHTSVICSLIAVLAISGQARELSIEQAEQLALEHSFALKRASAQQESAQAGLGAAQADRFGHISLNAAGSWISDIPKLTISLPTMTLNRDVGIHENYQTDLRLSIPLFTGGKLGAGIAQAKAGAELQDALRRATREQVRFAVRTEFLTALAAESAVRVAEASQKRAETIVADAQSLYAAGAADSVALLEAELALTRAQLAVQNAGTGKRQADIRLTTLCGLPIGEPLILVSPPAAIDEPIDITVDSGKPELATAAAAVKAQQARLRRTRADYLPNISAFGGYSYGRPNLDRFNNTWNDYFTAGASLTWSFSLGGRTHKEQRAAQWSLEAARQEQRAVGESLQQGADLAAEQLRLAVTREATATKELALSRASFRLAQEQHREGTLSSNRLLTIESDLTASEISADLAAISVQLAQTAYLYALGRL